MGSVFDGLIRKGALGGFGLENIGNVSKLNGTVKLADSFTPRELLPRRPDEEYDEEYDEREIPYRYRPREPVSQPVEQPPKFFGDVKDNNMPDFFGKITTVKTKKKTKEKVPDFFPPNPVTRGIPKEVNFFNDLPKPNTKKPLISSLNEGVTSFDSSFGNQNALKRGTGFDNFVGDINIDRLSRGEPDSAVPLTGVFADKRKGVDTHVIFPQDSPNLSAYNKTRALPNPEGFENGLTQAPTSGKRKAGRPFGSLGKKKRKIKKLEEIRTNKKLTPDKGVVASLKDISIAKPRKKKKLTELTKARLSLLEEQSRLNEGGAPRNALQAKYYSSEDNSFRSLFG